MRYGFILMCVTYILNLYSQGNLTKCPPPVGFKFAAGKGDGKEWVLRQKSAAEVDNFNFWISVQNLMQMTFFFFFLERPGKIFFFLMENQKIVSAGLVVWRNAKSCVWWGLKCRVGVWRYPSASGVHLTELFLCVSWPNISYVHPFCMIELKN